MTKNICILLLSMTLPLLLTCCGAPAEEKGEDPDSGGEITGNSWRTQRSCSIDLPLTEDLTVCLSPLDDGGGFGVYDAGSGDRTGTLFLPEGAAFFPEGDILCEDRDGDGTCEIGIPLEGGALVWYGYDSAPKAAGSESPESPFYMIQDPPEEKPSPLVFPYEAPVEEEVSPSVEALYNEIWPKVASFEYFYYDTGTYGYEFMDDLLLVMGLIHDRHYETRCYFQLREFNNEEGYLTGMESRYACFWEPEPGEEIGKVRKAMEDFDAKTEEILSGITPDMSAYDRYLYLARVISENADYAWDPAYACAAASPWGGVMGGYSICEGYSAAMEYLCSRADLYCRIVFGSSGEESHSWNLVRLPEGTYHVDVTWCDGAGLPGDESWMTWFMLTQEEIERDHVIGDGTVATGM